MTVVLALRKKELQFMLAKVKSGQLPMMSKISSCLPGSKRIRKFHEKISIVWLDAFQVQVVVLHVYTLSVIKPFRNVAIS